MWRRPTEREASLAFPQTPSESNLLNELQLVDAVPISNLLIYESVFCHFQGAERYTVFGKVEGVDCLIDNSTGRLWSRKPLTADELESLDREHLVVKYLAKAGRWVLPNLEQLQSLIQFENQEYPEMLRNVISSIPSSFLLDDSLVYRYGLKIARPLKEGEQAKALYKFSTVGAVTKMDARDPERFEMVGDLKGRQAFIDYHTGRIWAVHPEEPQKRNLRDLEREYFENLQALEEARARYEKTKQELLKAKFEHEKGPVK